MKRDSDGWGVSEGELLGNDELGKEERERRRRAMVVLPDEEGPERPIRRVSGFEGVVGGEVVVVVVVDMAFSNPALEEVRLL